MGTNKRRGATGHGGFSIPGRFGVCYAAFSLMAVLVGVAECLSVDVPDGETACVIVHAPKDEAINGNYEVLTPMSSKHTDKVAVVLREADGGMLLYKHEGVEGYFQAQAAAEGDYELCFINSDDDELRRVRQTPFRGLPSDAIKRKEKMDQALKDGGDKGKEDSDVDDKVFIDIFGSMYGQIQFPHYDDDDWYSQEYDAVTFGFNLRLGLAPGLAQDSVRTEEKTSDDDGARVMMMLDEAKLLMRSLAEFGDHESNKRAIEELHREAVTKTSTSLLWATLIEAAVMIWVSWAQLSYIRRFFETKRML